MKRTLASFLALTMSACAVDATYAPPPDVHEDATAEDAPMLYWWAHRGPVTVRVDDCGESFAAAARVWERYPGELFEIVDGDADVEVHLGAPNPGMRATTFIDYEGPGVETGEITHARIAMGDCAADVLAHELGHALGLGHAEREGALMTERGRGESVSAYEMAVARTYAR